MRSSRRSKPPKGCRCISLTYNSMPTAQKARSFSSAAARLAESVNAHKNITVDVGQVMFGQTVTISGDVTRQFSGGRPAQRNGRSSTATRTAAELSRTIIARRIFTTRCNGRRIGVVPADRRSLARLLHYGSSQWRAVHGLSRSLRAVDGSRSARRMDREIAPAAMAMSTLQSIRREYTFPEIAVMTRASPARCWA